jgi:hypothetical protein
MQYTLFGVVSRLRQVRSKPLALDIKNKIWKDRTFPPSVDSLSDYWRRQVLALT